MIPRKDPIEIYAREINDEMTLNLFLKAQLYSCLFTKANTVAQARYFAPHFGQQIARQLPGISAGISYLARIDRVEVVEDWNDLIGIVHNVRGKTWLNKNEA